MSTRSVIERPIGRLEITATVSCRLLGEQLDSASFGVFARERALRASQHFDSIEVEQLEDRP